MELSVRTGVRCPRSGRSTYHRLRLAEVALLPVRERGEAHAPPQHPARASSHPAHWSVAPPECGAPPPPLWMPPWPASTPSDRVSGLPSQRASGRANTTTGTPPAALSLSLSLSPPLTSSCCVHRRFSAATSPASSAWSACPRATFSPSHIASSVLSCSFTAATSPVRISISPSICCTPTPSQVSCERAVGGWWSSSPHLARGGS
jgi:hypothetical protein